MQIEDNKIFNLMDTNGRRKDVTNALQIYLSILNKINPQMKWAALPKSLAQFTFYTKAKEASPDVFQNNATYDSFIKNLENYPELKDALNSWDLEFVQENYDKYKEEFFNKKFDANIEQRARHYTSNLVKMGFTDDSRLITDSGKALLEPSYVNRDSLEKLLPIDNTNLIYSRQLIKLRVYNTKDNSFYSPFCMALCILLKNEKVSEDSFLKLIQGYCFMSKHMAVKDMYSDITTAIAGLESSIFKEAVANLPAVLNNKDLTKDQFLEVFKNRKDPRIPECYWEFYNKLKPCIENPTYGTIEALLEYYSRSNVKNKIDKAFGRENALFDLANEDIRTPAGFRKLYSPFFEDSLNCYLYEIYYTSTTLNQITENSDTTRRMFDATGLIRFKNRIVELAYPKLCHHIFKIEKLQDFISGNPSQEGYVSCEDYEENPGNFFSQSLSLCDIFKYTKEELSAIREALKKEYGELDVNQISEIASDEREEGFRNYIEEQYPVEKIKKLLKLFKDRTKDEEIKKDVCSNASIPTICEYITGIAWYYFSGKRIRLLRSFNLSLTAGYEPLIHAGGGCGDIVIHEPERVVMLEVTLMDPNSQKRGEWEPVLRHSVNLKTQEEQQDSSREVSTFFVADDFDSNSINIWKAVSSVPLQSSRDKTLYTDSVVIMPLKFDELADLVDKSENYDKIMTKTQLLFKKDRKPFDINWRKDFMAQIKA